MSKKILQLKKFTYKYLLLGSNGLLGSELKKILPKQNTICVARNKSDINLNLENFNKLKKIFEKYKIKNVINCVAITNLGYCEKNKLKCKKINLLLPNQLIEYSKKYGFKIVNISTDQVYCTKYKKKNKETDKVSYLNFYSKTKFLCEKNLKKIKKSLIIRTNFTGFKKDIKSTFVGWLLDSIKKKKKIYLFNDMHVSILDAKTCAKIIKKLIMLDAKGIYNVGTKYSLTKKDFALKFSKKLKNKIYYLDKSVNSLKLKRPRFLALDVRKVEKKIKDKMITPNDSINNLIKEIPK